jgi:hypothetical protein
MMLKLVVDNTPKKVQSEPNTPIEPSVVITAADLEKMKAEMAALWDTEILGNDPIVPAHIYQKRQRLKAWAAEQERKGFVRSVRRGDVTIFSVGKGTGRSVFDPLERT